MTRRQFSLSFSALLVSGCSWAGPASPPAAAAPLRTDRIDKPDAVWRAELSPEQYRVLRQQGTERAYSGAYWDDHSPGAYACAACGLVLFGSDDKFDSGTGWPSFSRPAADDRVSEQVDTSLGVPRTELRCARCGGHLGHVFNDGPAPTGQRYCINSVSLKKIPAASAPR